MVSPGGGWSELAALRTESEQTSSVSKVRSNSTAHQSLWAHTKAPLFVGASTSIAALLGAAAFLIAVAVRQGPVGCAGTACSAGPYLAIAPFAALIRAIFFVRRKPWKKRRTKGYFEEVNEAIVDAALGSLVLIVFTFMFRSGYRFSEFSYSRLVFIYDWLFASLALVGLMTTTKLTLGELRRRGHNQRNVAVVEDHHSAGAFRETIRRHPEMGYAVVGEVTWTGFDVGNFERVRERLLEITDSARVDEVLLAVPRLDKAQLSTLVGVAALAHIELKAMPELFGLPPSKVSLDSVGGLPVLGLLAEPLPGGRRGTKRAIDIVTACVLLVVAAPIFAAIALAVRITSRGPIFISQERVGMDGRPFRMMKFRSMWVDRDDSEHREYMRSLIQGSDEEIRNGRLFKVTDPRVTSVGRVIRRLSLDELPQLLNVLRGEMSIVGPRPPLPFEVAMYEEWHRRRLEVRPGITGLWQVRGRSTLTFEEMVRLDIEYIDAWSPLRDIMILARTIPAVIRSETN